MNTPSHLQRLVVLLLGLFTGIIAQATSTIWNGPNIPFSEAPGANPSLPANQDRITSDIWITRSTTQGLFNAFDEGSFTHFLSPRNTSWADGTLANYASLSYTDWNSWAKGVHAGPPSTVGVPVVVHLLPDDIYLSLQFTSWGGSGGGFSYIRSTAPVPEPSSTLLLILAGLSFLAGKRFAQG